VPEQPPYEYVTSAERLGHIANEILDSSVIGIDIETTGYNPNIEGASSSPFRDDIRILSVNTGKGIYVIDAYATGTLEKPVRALEETKGITIAQNAKMEQKWLLQKLNAELWPLFDTYRASALIHNGRDLKHDLYSIYERELGMAPPTEDLGGSDWSGVLDPKQIKYAASDVSYLHQLRDKLKPQLAKWGLNQVAMIEFGAILPESAIELNGMPFDQEAWLALAAQNEIKAEELRKQLVWELPNPKSQLTLLGFEPNLNLNSPPQMLASLRQLGIRQQCLECRGKGTNRERSKCPVCRGRKEVELQDTQEMTIAMYAAEHPVIRKFIDFRGYSRAVSTFGPEFLRWVDPTTGRIHTSFFPFTGAGRYASSRPNLQNIPRDAAFRRCFRAPSGSLFVGGDWSNIEMRIAAELSQDPRLLEVFRKNLDAHRVTASALMGIAMESVSDFQRQQAKPVNFGFLYGMMPPKMVLYAMSNYGVALTLRQSTEFRSKYFQLYSRLPSWHDKLLEEGPKRGFARNKVGRIRYLSEDAHNEWLNTDVQGLGAEGLKRALRTVYFRLKKHSPWNGTIKMINHIHDEIITQTPEDMEIAKVVEKELDEGMTEAMQPLLPSVPVTVGTGIGTSWADT
jgi:DNA polymerase I-like protein with 3'-5' exonuclease and polymerase domains